MPSNDSINKLLKIKDKNIIFTNEVYDNKINNYNCTIIEAKLTYKPNICPICKKSHPKLYSKGYSKPSYVLVNALAGNKTYIHLKKKRYHCLECDSHFTLETSLVDKHCYISNGVKKNIAINLTNSISSKDIGFNNHVSVNTVTRTMNASYQFPKTYKKSLPTILSFDEFKSVKSAKSKMSFTIVDIEKHKIVDIVEDRSLESLRKYFKYYTKEARKMVKIIIIDMHEPYMVLIKEMFPNAKIVIDRFHIIQLVNRSFNKTRVNLMNKIKKENNKGYTLLKRNWKLLLKNRNELDNVNYKKYVRGSKMMTQYQLVKHILSLDSEFEKAYDFYQDIIFCFHDVKKCKNRQKLVDKFNKIIEKDHSYLSDIMKTSLKTLNKYKSYITNAIIYDYSNGIIEGINNKIKVIKRVSYGYRSFANFKLRIMIIFNLINKPKAYS